MPEPDEQVPSTRAAHGQPPAPPALIGAEQVRRIAGLAHLALLPDEVERFTRDLGNILAYEKQLEALDVEGVPPTTHVGLDHLPLASGDTGFLGPAPLRADDVVESLPREVALREAPRVAMEGFAVPSFVDEG
jgi:aspartyl-tRNA(Asn)/glutamyl-tRNA(Gln) amidotransferase subunit C